jgi:hypothetical protein
MHHWSDVGHDRGLNVPKSCRSNGFGGSGLGILSTGGIAQCGRTGINSRTFELRHAPSKTIVDIDGVVRVVTEILQPVFVEDESDRTGVCERLIVMFQKDLQWKIEVH